MGIHPAEHFMSIIWQSYGPYTAVTLRSDTGVPGPSTVPSKLSLQGQTVQYGNRITAARIPVFTVMGAQP